MSFLNTNSESFEFETEVERLANEDANICSECGSDLELYEHAGHCSRCESELKPDEFEMDLDYLELEDERKRGKRSFRRPSGRRPRSVRRPSPRVKKTPRLKPRPPRTSGALRPRPKRPQHKPGKRPIIIRPRRRRRVVIREPTSPCVCPAHGTEFVRWVQSSLNQISGLRLRINGVMNRATRDALRDFQKRKGLPVDGIAGPETERTLVDAKGGGNKPAAAEFEWEEAPGLAHSSGHIMNQEVGFNSPNRTPRKVRATFVSCNRPRGRVKAITGPDPVGRIRKVNTRAIELLDAAIIKLQDMRKKIVDGATPAIVPDPDNVRKALRRRFHMNANDRKIWIKKGGRSVDTVIRRLRGSRQILADGWMKYRCLGKRFNAIISRGGKSCEFDNGCDKGTHAMSCGAITKIVLCKPFWKQSNDEVNGLNFQAGTLLHECFHIYFGFIGDSGNFVNAHCYEQFVFDLNGDEVRVPVSFKGSCP